MKSYETIRTGIENESQLSDYGKQFDLQPFYCNGKISWVAENCLINGLELGVNEFSGEN